MLDGRPHQVLLLGVLPSDFSFDHQASASASLPNFVPFLLNDYYTLRSGSHTHLRRVLALARLEPEVTMESANAESASCLSAWPRTIRISIAVSRRVRMGFIMRVRSLHEAVSGDSRGALLLLLAAVGSVLLIACANAAQFLLARSLQRQNEIAVRFARWATRARLMQQFFVEAALLAGVSAALGLWSGQLLVRGLDEFLNPLVAAVVVGADRYNRRGIHRDVGRGHRAHLRSAACVQRNRLDGTPPCRRRDSDRTGRATA